MRRSVARVKQNIREDQQRCQVRSAQPAVAGEAALHQDPPDDTKSNTTADELQRISERCRAGSLKTT